MKFILYRLKNSYFNLYNLIISFFIVIVILIFSFYFNRFDFLLYKENKNHIFDINSQKVQIIKNQVNSEFKFLHTLSSSITYNKNKNININKTVSFLKDIAESNNVKRLGIILEKGQAYTSDGYVDNFSDREYFKSALKGHSYISDTLIDKFSGEEIIVYSVPLYDNDKPIGAIFSTHLPIPYSNILSLSNFQCEESSCIAKPNGDIIINSIDFPILLNEENKLNLMNYSKDVDIKKLDKLMNSISKKENGLIEVSFKNNDKIICYSYTDINDWVLITTIDKNTFLGEYKNIFHINYYIFVILILILGVILNYIIYCKNKYSIKNQLSNNDIK